MNKFKKIAEKALSLLCIIIVLIAVIVLVTVYANKDKGIPLFGGRTIMLVVSPSMEPEYKAYTCVYIKKVDPATLKLGDDITFYSEDPSIYMKVVTHRIVGIDGSEGDLSFTTRGINNSAEDGYPVSQSKVIGKVTGQSELLGTIVSALSRTEVFIVLIAVPILLIIIVNVNAFRKKMKEIAYNEVMNGSDSYRFFTLDEISKKDQLEQYSGLVSGSDKSFDGLNDWTEYMNKRHMEEEISFRVMDGKACIMISLASCDLVDNYKTFHVFLVAVDKDYIAPGLLKQSFEMSKKLAANLKCHRIMITLKKDWERLYSGYKLTKNTSYSDESLTTLEQRL